MSGSEFLHHIRMDECPRCGKKYEWATDYCKCTYPVSDKPKSMMTLPELLDLLGMTEMVYIHDEDGKATAIVIPVKGWWNDQLPDAPVEHFGHEHVFLGEEE